MTKNISFLKEYNLKGVANVIQAAGEKDCLLLPCKTSEQQEKLLSLYLPSTFKGLLVSPFSTDSVIHLKRSVEEIKVIEDELIEFFYPLKTKPKFYGITGTNGKTSVAWLISEIYKTINKKVLYMGTPGVYIAGEKKSDNVLTTTPSYLDIRKALFKYGNEVAAIALELSSHALAQGRLKSLAFDSIGWTNFSQDHLDFHKTMEEYFVAKSKIVELGPTEIILPREKVELIERISTLTKVSLTDSIENYAKNIPREFLFGFSRENLEVAFKMVSLVEDLPNPIDLEVITLPPGRIQKVQKGEILFFVDYAHTPDALEKVIEQLRTTYPTKKLITVFGCGGDRDNSKRPIMGKVASTGSDVTIVTSDNPRTENPQKIIDDILKGCVGRTHSILDRRNALKKAWELANSNTLVLVAGKGHEAYQEINGVRHDFNDVEVIRSLN